MAKRPKNKAKTYSRRSSGKQETSLETQLGWAVGEAARHQVALNATLDDLAFMKAQRLHQYKDICLDDSITGADLERPGFVAFIETLLADKSYSHAFIHKRDRLARPEDAIEMVQRERRLLLAGITIVYSDSVSEPMDRGRQYMERDLTMLMGYYESGAFLTKLAERILEKQRLLALDGFRVGGNAPYGFERVLVDSRGNILEHLLPGRRVRQAGCHVRVIPQVGFKLTTRLLILDLKQKGWGIKRIASHLDQLGVPSPDAGKTRTDRGVVHLVSGKWSPGTVREICQDPINIGLQEYGRRSEGAHRRLGDEGPRLLNDGDRSDCDRPRTIRNDSSLTIKTATGGESIMDATAFEEMNRQIEVRGKAQRGIPRAKDPSRYPLSCRIVDLTDGCGSPMYGRMHGQRPIYVCGDYMRTNGAVCENNTIDAEAILRFTLKTLSQIVGRPGSYDKLRSVLLERAKQRSKGETVRSTAHVIEVQKEKIKLLRDQKSTAQRRMTLETDDNRYKAMAEEFDRICVELDAAEQNVEAEKRPKPTVVAPTPEKTVEAAITILAEVQRIATDEAARSRIPLLLSNLGVWIGMSFGSSLKGKKRIVRRLQSGVMTFGDKELPVPVYGSRNRQGGPNSCQDEDGNRVSNKGGDSSEFQEFETNGKGVDCGGKGKADTEAPATVSAASSDEQSAGSGSDQPEGISFTKDSRGDRI